MPNLSLQRPAARSFHAAVKLDTSIIIMGGRDGSTARSDVWEGRFPGGVPPWTWKRIFATSPDSLGPRYAHEAVYAPDLKRVFVFGGTANIGADPTDAEVWSMSTDSLGFGTARWTRCTSQGTYRPSARIQHSFTLDDNVLKNATEGNVYRAFLYGGRTQWSGAPNRDTLWTAWLKDGATVVWQAQAASGTWPGMRARHGALTYPPEEQLVFFGGDVQGLAIPDSTVWVGATGCSGQNCAHDASPVTFTQAPSMVAGRAGLRASFNNGDVQTRVPEIFDPATGHWTAYPDAPLREEWYPFAFVLPASVAPGHTKSVFVAGPDVVSHLLDLSTSPAWTGYPTDSTTFGNKGGTAVMYRLGKVMKCGTRDTEGNQFATDTTCSVDLTEYAAQWRLSANDMWFRRVNHNLVLLPTGEALVVGGTRWSDNSIDSLPNHQPEIWDPDYTDPGSPGRRGYWYGADPNAAVKLDSSSADRNYHSNALLLPDARVLCASGNTAPWYTRADLYSPPYLFNADGTTRTRSTILGTKGRLAYGDTFSVVVDSTNVSFVLLRGGASTHGFNMDQRYIPLADYWGTQPVTNPPMRTLRIPGTADSVPPGPYMLFGVKPWGTPTVARWLNIGNPPPSRDWGDVVRPGKVADLTPDCVPGTDDWTLTWTAPADDSSFSVTGPVSAYDIRTSSSHITEANWNSLPGGSGPTPGAPGSQQTWTITVSPGSKRYVRLKSRDDLGTSSFAFGMLSNEVVVGCAPLPCDCSGSGMFAGGGDGGGASLKRAPAPASLQSAAGALTGNSLLNRVAVGRASRDDYRLPALAPTGIGSTYSIWMREAEGHAASVDAARLLIADCAAGSKAYALAGAIVAGSRAAASRVEGADGSDLTATLDGSGSYALADGDSILVDLGTSGGTRPMILEVSGSGLLEIQLPDGASGWRTIETCAPRVAPDELAAPAPGADRVRIVSRGRASLSFVGSLLLTENRPIIQEASLVAATSTRLGNVTGSIASPDSVSATFLGADTLRLVYSVPPDSAEGRDYILAVTATPLDAEALTANRLKIADAELPQRFALEQNLPNPFSGRTLIRFAMPTAGSVRLEVFDLAGRRLRALALGPFVAGYHAVEWDHRDASGNLVRPGVYLYRLIAGAFQDQRKMVLLGR